MVTPAVLLVMQHQETVPSLIATPPPAALFPLMQPPVSAIRRRVAPPSTMAQRLSFPVAVCLTTVLSQP